MDKHKIISIIVGLAAFGYLFTGLWFLKQEVDGLKENTVLGAPASQTFREVLPTRDAYVSLGTTTARWLNIFTSASSTFGGALNVGGSATSTFTGNGISLRAGCFQLPSGNCLTQGISVVGSDTQVIFNDGGSAFAGDSGFTFNKTTDILTIAGGLVSQASSTFTNDLHIIGNINASSTATSTFAGGISSVGLASSAGLTITGGSINHTGGATSTFSNGITLTAGCIFKVATGACISEINPSLTGILEQAGGVIGAVTVGSGLNYTGTSLTLDLASNNTFTGLQNFGNSATSTQNGGMKFNNGINTAFISSSGRLELGTGSATSTLQYDPDNGGQLTMATSSDIVVLAQANKNPYGINIPNVSTASSSHPLFGKPYAHNIWGITCPTDKGTVVLHLNNSTGLQSNQITCTTASSTIFRITQNGKRSLVEPTTVIIESTTGNPGVVSIGLFSTTTPQ